MHFLAPILAFTALATATPGVLQSIKTRTDAPSCVAAGGALTCCESKYGAQQNGDAIGTSPIDGLILNLLNIPLSLLPINTKSIGINCSGLNLLNTGMQCGREQTVCCQAVNPQNNQPALISILNGGILSGNNICPAIQDLPIASILSGKRDVDAIEA